jgi:hypothetical protein
MDRMARSTHHRRSLPSIVLLAAAIALPVIATGCRLFDEVREETFGDAAAASQLVEHGWIPEFLPPSASDGHIRYDLDDNETILSFSYAPADAGTLEAACTPASNVPTPAVRASWFPVGIENDADAVYACEDGYLALRGSTAYYWSEPAALTVADLDTDPERYVYLNEERATITGYVDFANVHDRRDTQYGEEAIGLAGEPGRYADPAMFAVFPDGVDPHPLFDEIYAARPGVDEGDVRVMVTGILTVSELPTNFSTSLGYLIAVADPTDVDVLGP